ncbi:GntR family transcriptional regulator [Clostridium transplantifaecale]|uniref:GntR family transcriptional regulator n=1 Tax=Clostridium transplantifaecale TaxID=2479838 RepID=UPI000F6431A3|nr:GntR family transcriptional regulator [Clostridium transplantifaecale]
MLSSEELICRSVYDYFEARILMDRYHTGDRLPSIMDIAKAFQLAPGTVRAALLMLAGDGYIHMEAKRVSVVVYNAKQKERESNTARHYAQRYEGVLDLLQSGTYLMQPMLAYGLRRMDDDCWARLQEKWGQPPGEQIVPSSIQFYAQVFASLDSTLILNLYWEIDRYIRFSYLCDWDVYQTLSPALNIKDREEAAVQIESSLQTAIGETSRTLLNVCNQARTRYQAEEQIPLRWTVYRQRRQLCYTLVARIIRKIASGIYPVGSFLPALPRMAEQLEVSLSTLRRTLSILGSLGVVRSYHGKGTLVCMEVGNIDFSRNEIRDGMLYYWESLQFLAITARTVTLYMLQNISEGDRAEFTTQFIRMCELERCHRCFDITLAFIVERCPLMLVRECYGKLQEFLAWGYPFTLNRLRSHNLQSEYAGAIQRAADFLEQQDWEGFALEFEALMFREEKFAKSVLADSCGWKSGYTDKKDIMAEEGVEIK